MHVVIIHAGSQVTMLMKGHFLDGIDSVWHYVAKWRSKVSSIIVNIGPVMACYQSHASKQLQWNVSQYTNILIRTNSSERCGHFVQTTLY